MTFLADCMLGKLARWLRILGYDTVYSAFAEDDDLLARACEENRILLTRDGPLHARASSGKCIHIDFDDLDRQMAQLVVTLGVSLDREPFTRCLSCNVPIQSVAPEDARPRVPVYIHRTQTEFFECLECGRVYWRGTHVDRMDERLERIRRCVRTIAE